MRKNSGLMAEIGREMVLILNPDYGTSIRRHSIKDRFQKSEEKISQNTKLMMQFTLLKTMDQQQVASLQLCIMVLAISYEEYIIIICISPPKNRRNVDRDHDTCQLICFHPSLDFTSVKLLRDFRSLSYFFPFFPQQSQFKKRGKSRNLERKMDKLQVPSLKS